MESSPGVGPGSDRPAVDPGQRRAAPGAPGGEEAPLSPEKWRGRRGLRPLGPRGKGAQGLYCLKCGVQTNGGKRYCVEHLDGMPYVRWLRWEIMRLGRRINVPPKGWEGF